MESPPHRRRHPPPAVLARIGRDLVRNGESLHVLEVVNGRLVLPPAEWDVVGAWPILACYQVDMPQPGLDRQAPRPTVPAGWYWFS